MLLFLYPRSFGGRTRSEHDRSGSGNPGKVAVAIDGEKACIQGKNVRLVERHKGVCIYGLLARHVDVTKLDRPLSDDSLWRAAAQAIQDLKKQDLVFSHGSSVDRESIWVVME